MFDFETQKMNVKAALITAGILISPLVVAGDISGFWKHTEELAWIEIRLEERTGVVLRTDKHPDRVGRILLKDLSADGSEPNVWRGKVYAVRLGEYKDAKISLIGTDKLSITVEIGFFSRTVDWLRVDEIPAE